MSTHSEQQPAKSKANTPKDDTEAARQSGQFGADKPSPGEQPYKRESDKTPNRKGAEFEEGGQYPGKRPDGN
ncbi:hypothetical protein [Achromobacter sp. NFACC18-2]|uniref:hypothetical protein n=1 Tax=Achromobacter sp. NFACC18-2 TaxID=1564112 RepID=UPI0008C4441A|nr:hypothetical protein [Achromobacter sp. NFACC18-2]SEI44486.1 hypothetical protein SAMN03159494_00307 [Achromobacter sp. NFACC18-2]